MSKKLRRVSRFSPRSADREEERAPPKKTPYHLRATSSSPERLSANYFVILRTRNCNKYIARGYPFHHFETNVENSNRFERALEKWQFSTLIAWIIPRWVPGKNKIKYTPRLKIHSDRTCAKIFLHVLSSLHYYKFARVIPSPRCTKICEPANQQLTRTRRPFRSIICRKTARFVYRRDAAKR